MNCATCQSCHTTQLVINGLCHECTAKELAEVKAELALITAALPVTYYAGLPTAERVKVLVEHWRRLVPIAEEFDKVNAACAEMREALSKISNCDEGKGYLGDMARCALARAREKGLA